MDAAAEDMPKAPAENLNAFLHRQPPATLVEVLLELAEGDPAVKDRLLRLQMADRPEKLAAGFRKTLAAWQRSTRSYSYRDTPVYGRRLQTWLDQVARELVPKDPAAGLALFEAFIEADGAWFEHADDSGGDIGDAVRSACRHWLQAAARCETPPDVWPERLMRLYLEDDYGSREELIRSANLLLSEPALRALVAQFECRMAKVLADASRLSHLPHEVFQLSAALSLLSQALGDPDVSVKAVLQYSPHPNELQKQSFVQAYLDVGRPEDALPWLEGKWEGKEDARESLRAVAFERLGRFQESESIRRNMFDEDPSVFNFRQWLQHLSEAQHAAALERAHQTALSLSDPATAASLLIEVGDIESAEARLVAEAERLREADLYSLEGLAKAMHARQRWRGETVVYRALLLDILTRAYAKAYRHGGRYWARLCEISASGADISPLQSHEDFAAELRLRHGRKTAFWAQVNARRDGTSAAEDCDGDVGFE